MHWPQVIFTMWPCVTSGHSLPCGTRPSPSPPTADRIATMGATTDGWRAWNVPIFCSCLYCWDGGRMLRTMPVIILPCSPACDTKQRKWQTIKDRRAQTQSKRSKDLLTFLLVQSRLTRNRFLHLYMSRSGKSNVNLLRRTRKGPLNSQTLLPPRPPRPALPREVVSQMRLDMEPAMATTSKKTSNCSVQT